MVKNHWAGLGGGGLLFWKILQGDLGACVADPWSSPLWYATGAGGGAEVKNDLKSQGSTKLLPL